MISWKASNRLNRLIGVSVLVILALVVVNWISLQGEATAQGDLSQSIAPGRFT